MFFGLTIEKLLLIGLIAGVLIGPERLPKYAETAARLTGRVREYIRGARTRVKEEMGDEFDDVDWRKLDPRRYDPRRIIREALLDDAPLPPVRPAAAATAVAARPAPIGPVEGVRVQAVLDPPPFDPEST